MWIHEKSRVHQKSSIPLLAVFILALISSAVLVLYPAQRECKDGTFTRAKHGACSHHGGLKR